MIQRITRTVFHAPMRGRSYFTARAAAKAEAGAMMVKHYPTEREDYDPHSGSCIDAGWHWTTDPNLLKVATRLERALLRKLRKEPK